MVRTNIQLCSRFGQVSSEIGSKMNRKLFESNVVVWRNFGSIINIESWKCPVFYSGQFVCAQIAL